MLSRLHLHNFTVFEDADFNFSEGLNVLVGTNGTGKSHVLKVGYGVTYVVANKALPNEVRASASERGIKPSEQDFFPNEANLEIQLKKLFLTGKIREVIRRGTDVNSAAVILGKLGDDELTYSLPNWDFVDDPKLSGHSLHSGKRIGRPVFIPPKEVLSIYPGFAQLYQLREISFDATYAYLCEQLAVPLLRELKGAQEKALQSLEQLMSGTVRLDGNRFYFLPSNEAEQMTIDLAAEGVRKLGMLMQLLRNGSLTHETTLFWDEPEANLNPALLKKLAAVLAELARQGFQIILATHSLFLLKEFHILSRQKNASKLPIRYFGLNKPEDQPNAPVVVTAVDDFELLPDIVALDEELAQAEKLEDIFAAEDNPSASDSDADAAHR